MSYAMSAALQEAVFQHLSNDVALSGMGAVVADRLPQGALPQLYLTIGAERVKDASDASSSGAWHDLVVMVKSDAAGFQVAKQAAGAASDALQNAGLTLGRGRLVSLRFVKAQARREKNGNQRIDMVFRARVEDDD